VVGGADLNLKTLEATTGFEPVITVLQTAALPLGYVAAPSRVDLSWSTECLPNTRAF
jgi:hypothetical protein